MKKLLLLLSTLFLITACNSKSDQIDKVADYYAAFNDSDYEQLKNLIADSISIVEGDYTMPFTHETFYEQFKWDSIFKPTYKVVALEQLNNQVLAKVEVHSLRFDFLKNNPLTCQHKISFEAGKITKFETLDCIDADWAIWEKERDSLVVWIGKRHPELDGFINDLSMNGAIKYLKAIELYKNR